MVGVGRKSLSYKLLDAGRVFRETLTASADLCSWPRTRHSTLMDRGTTPNFQLMCHDGVTHNSL